MSHISLGLTLSEIRKSIQITIVVTSYAIKIQKKNCVLRGLYDNQLLDGYIKLTMY